MTNYISGDFLKSVREECKLTQKQLAFQIGVTDKAVSKWETGKGYPDITLLPDIAKRLGISVTELLSGECNRNTNKSANMRKGKFYICPVCGNVLFSTGSVTASCCGVTLIAAEPEEPNTEHYFSIEKSEDEYYVTSRHSMAKDHFISFFAAVGDNGVIIVKQYPEMNARARFKINRTRDIYAYCNKHGLFKVKVK